VAVFFRVAIFALIVFSPASAFAESRIALVIGNASYDKSVGALKNPVKDAVIVANALAAQDFEMSLRIAEDITTYSRRWLYPSQKAWHPVPLQMRGFWFL
jgi:hypothetical protein